MGQNDEWLLARFTDGVIPPFSFVYNGKKSSDFLKDWQFHRESKQLDDARTEHIFTYTDTETKLRVCVGARCSQISRLWNG